MPDERRQSVVGVIAVFSALQDESTETQFISGAAAGQDGVRCKPVAHGVRIAFADSAVQTIIPAVVGELDQAADVDIPTVIEFSFFPCKREEVFGKIRRPVSDQSDPLIFGKAAVCPQLMDELYWFRSVIFHAFPFLKIKDQDPAAAARGNKKTHRLFKASGSEKG